MGKFNRFREQFKKEHAAPKCPDTRHGISSYQAKRIEGLLLKIIELLMEK